MLSFEQKNKIGWSFVASQLNLSPLGRRALRGVTMRSEDESYALKRDLDNVESGMTAFRDFPEQTSSLCLALHKLKDVTATFHRLKRAILSEAELFEVKAFLLNLKEVKQLFYALGACCFTGIVFSDLSAPLALLDPYGSGALSFELYDRYSSRLAEIRRDKLAAEKQLAVNPYSEQLLSERSRIVALERAEEELVLAALFEKLSPYAESLISNAEAVGALDLALQKARLAEDWSLCRPTLTKDAISFEGMFNPQVAQVLESEGREFTPVSIALSSGTTVISGANMSGKSVILKTVALNTLLALSGFYVFADKACVAFVNDIIFLSLDAEDSDRGLSSFGGEIASLNEALEIVDQAPCLVLLDEFARGTNPLEGARIAAAVASYFNSKASFCLMTTHFNGVSDVASAHYRVRGLSESARLGDAASLKDALDYTLLGAKPDDPVPEDAVRICKMLGLRSDILDLIE